MELSPKGGLKSLLNTMESMGSVDAADMLWLHVQTNVVGLHRWWMKLFFHMMDVGTANAMILYKMATGGNNMNASSFKRIFLAICG